MIRRIFVEKKETNSEIERLACEIRSQIASGLVRLRLINHYDVQGLENESDWKRCVENIFSNKETDTVYDSLPACVDFVLAVRLLPGQYNQRTDYTVQCIRAVTGIENIIAETSRVYICEGNFTDGEKDDIRRFFINPVECMEVSLEMPERLGFTAETPTTVQVVNGFIEMDDNAVHHLHAAMDLAMRREDLILCRDHFRQENRNPTLTELKVIDTYWSDHCRHTTFTTELSEVIFEEGPYKEVFEEAFSLYKNERNKNKPITLMDMATAAMKSLIKRGLLQDLDESEEINACSIFVDVDVDGATEEWILQFKNETHNHPTEIEPYGGASTCLGGAIRDPLAGRAYVYQAMRVTGSGDPTEAFSKTWPGKLPQKIIATQAAAGYSDYGNQIGIAMGHGGEIYHEGYKAKRMELGAVVAAVKRENVCRETPISGDVVLLVGGRTGRDGCGGATGSSVGHTEDSLAQGGAEVQKGNPIVERNLLRLFKNPEAAKRIKRCNDFGAGGVSVAVGELADGLDIDLDTVPVKYEGLSGTELAISESQERMAVVVALEEVDSFAALAEAENLECTSIAIVNDSGRMVMRRHGTVIVDIARSFLNAGGAKRSQKVVVGSQAVSPYKEVPQNWLSHLSRLNIACQKGLSERFDATVNAGTVLMPFSGKHRLTPAQAMVAKLPVSGETNTVSIMAFGADPYLSEQSPFHGAVSAIVESVAKTVAVGGAYPRARLTFQEYFEALREDPYRWQKPFLALLGAFQAQMALELPAIGGKDSMSGSFEDKDVPPTFVSFCVQTAKTPHIISQELKAPGHSLVWLRAKYNEHQLPDFIYLKNSFSRITALIQSGQIKAAYALDAGGLASALTKMALGNGIGAEVTGNNWYSAEMGSFLLEMSGDTGTLLDGLDYILIGKTIKEPVIIVNGNSISLDDCHDAWLATLEPVYSTGRFEKSEATAVIPAVPVFTNSQKNKPNKKIIKPRICIPLFPGTNGEYDATRAFTKVGGKVDAYVLRNATVADLNESLKELEKRIAQSQILMLAGGFSAGDEPDGSGKYMAAILQKPRIADAIQDLLRRDGLILGIGNGFQSLVRAGLLEGFSMVRNCIGRHVSDLVMTKIVSNLSPWLWNTCPGDIYLLPVSHGEGRFVADEAEITHMINSGQIAAQYVDFDGKPAMDIRFNPNGSHYAVEAVTSPDGRILGKMSHSERVGDGLYKGFDLPTEQGIFKAGVGYYN